MVTAGKGGAPVKGSGKPDGDEEQAQERPPDGTESSRQRQGGVERVRQTRQSRRGMTVDEL
jgi:hypothetical protein